mgnify:FL=1
MRAVELCGKTAVNDGGYKVVRRERQREYEEELTRRRTELERVEKDAEFGSAINDMLANM